jgi:serine/threonine protein kinase
VLGHGSLEIVEGVRWKDTQLLTVVRKRVQLPARKAQAKDSLRIIQEEAKHLKSLVHSHIVTLLSSYKITDNPIGMLILCLCLQLATTICETLLDIAGESMELDPPSHRALQQCGWIQSWFVCLASALDYMHQQGIRHQDFKPSNIIHKGARIFFTDFSSSCAF